MQNHMACNKNLDSPIEIELICRLLTDAQASVGHINRRELKGSQQWLRRRFSAEGLGFLTKTLPSFGKHLDQVLAGVDSLKACRYTIPIVRGTKLPRFLGSLFSRVFSEDGSVLSIADAQCVRIIRNILYLFYKYKLPDGPLQKDKVLSQFVKTEEDLAESDALNRLRLSGVRLLQQKPYPRRLARDVSLDPYLQSCAIAREAKILLNRVIGNIDWRNIVPRHGPGVVSTKERLWSKFEFSNVASKIANVYPVDEYFFVNQGHVCDRLSSLTGMSDRIHSASVKLVPKDSRGPRIISCEPVDFQWIQQGIRQVLYERVESCRTTKYNIFFTNQQPNQFGALLGSKTGKYATLDLKEASDRVSLELVRLLFPESAMPFLEAARSEETTLPSGQVIKLRKYAPMGSALCFPVMALTIWSLLTAAAPDADTRESILVYGDDVIVPTAYAERAITVLEWFGLMVNRSKSCYHNGLFRESCGTDAFKGVRVTPVRIRTVWSESRSAGHYTSWIAYANQLRQWGNISSANFIADELVRKYGPIPDTSMGLPCPSLDYSPSLPSEFKLRVNRKLQKLEYRVLDVRSRKVVHVMDGWLHLLRYFTEAGRARPERKLQEGVQVPMSSDMEPFDTSLYTPRHGSMLSWCWR